MRRKNKSIYVILVILVLLGVSLGYAAINRTLNIIGNSEVKQNTWDIHFENIQVKKGSVEATKPIINNINLSIEFNFLLNLPGDFYEFTVDVVNDGTIDAMIDSVNKTPELSSEQKKYLNYIVEYQNGEQISSNQLVKSKEFVRLKVRVEYKTDITEFDLPITEQSLSLGFVVNYVQAEESIVKSIANNGIKIEPVTYKTLKIGTVVTIGSEQFYVIGFEEDNVKLLAKYNLYVGGEYNYNSGIWTAYGEEASEMQNENMKKDNNGIVHGSTMFSSDEQKGEYYSSYSGSIVEGYVNNYKDLLESKYGVNIVEARLITYEELISEDIGCTESNNKCDKAFTFVWNRTYWIGSSDTFESVMYVNTSYRIGSKNYDDYYQGVRPVIVIPTSDINVDIKPIANGELDIGTEVTINNERFYIMGIEGNNVKLFAKEKITYDENPVQDSTFAKPTPFSSDEQHGDIINDYKGSIVEGYVNNYKKTLESYGVEVIEARLITRNELGLLGCTTSSFKPIADWVSIPRNYWTGTADLSSIGIYTMAYLSVSIINYYDAFTFGVRPVIVISKDLF